MRENNRNPIERCRKRLPQFTTMNVIDGQAGLVIYSSLIFYSLTIDNILNIIVLLILAGVTISAVGGDNGILKNAQKARIETEEAQEKERIALALTNSMLGNSNFQALNQANLQNAMDNEFGKGKNIITDNGDGSFIVNLLDTNRDYIVSANGTIEEINWEEIMENALPPIDQTTEGVIGLDSNGNSVNMDLWEYTLYEGTYALNDIKDLEAVGGVDESKGYLGEIINGKIEGTIPKYIKASTDNEFIPVTSLKDTFININNDFDGLITTPVIPSTVTNMRSTFSRCNNLKNITNLSPNLINMRSTFFECTGLQIFNIVIPNKVTNMYGTFNGCESLETFDSLIPDSVTDMHATFNECINLQSFNSSIPKNVIDMYATFSQCRNLTYLDIVIPKSVTNLKYTFRLLSKFEWKNRNKC